MALRVDDDSPEWLRKRELPSSLEIKGEDENATIEEEIEIEVNRVNAAWVSAFQASFTFSIPLEASQQMSCNTTRSRVWKH